MLPLQPCKLSLVLPLNNAHNVPLTTPSASLKFSGREAVTAANRTPSNWISFYFSDIFSFSYAISLLILIVSWLAV